MRMFSKLTVSIVLVLSLASQAWSQEAEKEKILSPEEVVQAYFKDLASGDMKAAAKWMHTSELKKFRDMMKDTLGKMLDSPTIPSREKLLSGGTKKELLEAPPRVFFTRFLDWSMGLQAGTLDVLQKSKINAVGSCDEKIEGGKITHVVYRMTVSMAELKVTKLNVISMKLEGTKYRLLLTGEMETMAKRLKKQFF